MSLMLAGIALAALLTTRPTAALTWSIAAGLSPLVLLMSWHERLADATLDLGLGERDRWQVLAAGLLSTATLIGVTRLRPRIEIAWATVTVGVVAAVVAFTGSAPVAGTYPSLAVLFVALQIIALTTHRDELWKPVVAVVVGLGEVFAGLFTGALLVAAVLDPWLGDDLSTRTIGVAGALFALGWLTADRRRVVDDTDWLTGLLVGADWGPTTLLFPMSVMAIVVATDPPVFVSSLVAIALAYWMTATWRKGALFGTLALMVAGLHFADQAGPWIELGLGALGALVFVLAARLRIRAKETAQSVLAAFAAVVVWLLAAQSGVTAVPSGWLVVGVMLGAWTISWLVEERDGKPRLEPADGVGRLSAVVLLLTVLGTVGSFAAIAGCLAVVALSAIDLGRVVRRGGGHVEELCVGYAALGGASFALVGVPIVEIAELGISTGGFVLSVATMVAVGIALTTRRPTSVFFWAGAGAFALTGSAMSLDSPDALALSLMVLGATVGLVGASWRDLPIGVAGFISTGLGFSLQLAVWDVDWVEPYLLFPGTAALLIGYRHNRHGGTSWVSYAPTIVILSYVAFAARLSGGSAWHAVIAGAVGVIALIAGGYRRLAGPLILGTVIVGSVVGYESLGPAALVPTWAWLATGGSVLLAAGVAIERGDTTPLERGQKLRHTIATQYS